MDLHKLTAKASTSGFYLSVLNFFLNKTIPFNKPHGIKIVHIDDQSIETSLPYRRRNMNHIRGLHACALATLAEFTTGFMLVSKLNPKKYRIIMKSLRMDYQFQGKRDALAKFSITEDWLQKFIYQPLNSEDAVMNEMEIEVFDRDGNLLAVGHIDWQVKLWEKVRTKVA